MTNTIEGPRSLDRATGEKLAGELSRVLEAAASLDERLRLIERAFPGETLRVAFSTSLGIEDQAVIDAIARTGADVDVFTLDTGRHFAETLEVLDRSMQRYANVKIRVVTPEASETEDLVARDSVFGFRSSIEARKACCDVRKVRPLNRALSGAAGWITGLRRGQSSGRSAVEFATWDNVFGLVKINPIADWSLEVLEDYINEHDVPINALHAQGFPSIGCQPCTRAVQPGEDIRAGRWWWESDDGKECGLHKSPSGQPGSGHLPRMTVNGADAVPVSRN